MEKDLELKQWLEFHNRRFVTVATKTDKLKTQKDQHHGMAGLREQVPEGEVLPFSAPTCRGVREIWQAIRKIKIKQQ
jgi:GTP-binding protein